MTSKKPRLTLMLMSALLLSSLGSDAFAAPVATTTALAVSPNPALQGQTVTLTATVTGDAPRGEVVFNDVTPGSSSNLGKAVVSASGMATLSVRFNESGNRSLSAIYMGDAKNDKSSSPELLLTVNLPPTSTVLTANPNPADLDRRVTMSATVTGNGPEGNVIFKEGDTILGSGTIDVQSGVAVFSAPFGTKGDHLITASYEGDRRNAASSAEVSLAVNGLATSTVLTSPDRVPMGRTVTLKATVSGSTPAGTITFMDGVVSLGTATINAYGTATFDATFTTMGSHSITARYEGDTRNDASLSGAALLMVEEMVDKALSNTVLTVSPNPAMVGQSVTLTATVTSPAPAGSAPTGTVTFMDDSTALGTATVNASGIATLTTTFMERGRHHLTALYGGDTSNTLSDSEAVSLTVDRAISDTVLTVSQNSVMVGQNMILTATVTGVAPTGHVSFMDGNSQLDSVEINASGMATLTTSFATAGSHALTALYRGDTKNIPSESPAVSLMVDKALTSTVLIVSPNPAVATDVVRLTAEITGSAPTGTVTFSVGTIVRQANVVRGFQGTPAKATFSGSLPEGQYSITASYGGNANNTASSSAASSLTVGPAMCP